MSIRILLVDDHEIFTDGLRSLLSGEPDLEVVGQVADGRTAIGEVVECRPDVIVMDVSMPGLNGIEASREIKSLRPDVKVLILSMHAEGRFVQAALHAGASGYLLKECVLEELVRAIRAVAANQVYLSPAVAGTVVEAVRAGRSDAVASAFTVLTDRERTVLQLLAEGQSTKEIAACLHLSIKTIGTHREHIMKKVDIDNIAGLTKYAIREGLTSS